MTIRPDYIDPKWCDECGNEMRFSGVQVRLARFFCTNCTYRRDRRVGEEVQELYDADKAAGHL